MVSESRARAHDLNATRAKAKPGEALAFERSLAEREQPADECIPWPYSLDGSGHPGGGVTRRLLGLVTGDGLQAMHLCHRPDCVNPRHLKAGTPQENSQMMIDSGRSLAGERNPGWGRRPQRRFDFRKVIA